MYNIFKHLKKEILQLSFVIFHFTNHKTVFFSLSTNLKTQRDIPNRMTTK